MLGDPDASRRRISASERAELEWGQPPACAGTRPRSRRISRACWPMAAAAANAARRRAHRAGAPHHSAGVGCRHHLPRNSTSVGRRYDACGVARQPGVGGVDVIRRKSGISLSRTAPGHLLQGRLQRRRRHWQPTRPRQKIRRRRLGGGRSRHLIRRRREAHQRGDYALRARLHRRLGSRARRPRARAVRSADDIGPVLEVLGGPASPLRRLVAIVVDNTKFTSTTPPPPTPGAIAAAGRNIKEQLGKLQQAAGVPTITPGRLITAHFQPYHRLMDGEPGQTPLDRLITLIAQVRAAWDAVAALVTSRKRTLTLRYASRSSCWDSKFRLCRLHLIP